MSEMIQRADGFWTLDSPLRVGGLPMGTRTSVVRLASGGLFLHSPSSLAGDARQTIEALGEVAVIAAPNCFHHFFVQENVEAWPQASLFLAPGLRERQPKLPPGEVLGDEPHRWWTVEEIAAVFPATLGMDMPNPAPAPTE